MSLRVAVAAKNGQSIEAAGGFLAPNFKMKLLMNFSSISNVFYSLLDPQFCKKNPIWPLWPPFFTGDLYLLKIAQNSKNWKKKISSNFDRSVMCVFQIKRFFFPITCCLGKRFSNHCYSRSVSSAFKIAQVTNVKGDFLE